MPVLRRTYIFFKTPKGYFIFINITNKYTRNVSSELEKLKVFFGENNAFG